MASCTGQWLHYASSALQTPSSPSHLSWGDVTFDHASEPSIMKVHLRSSQCNQYGKGADVCRAKTGNALCPIAACQSYLTHRGHDGCQRLLSEAGVGNPWTTSGGVCEAQLSHQCSDGCCISRWLCLWRSTPWLARQL